MSRRSLTRRTVLAAVPVSALALTTGARAQDGTPAATDTPLRVAFVYVSPVGDMGWSWAHDQGRLALEENLAYVETAFQEGVPENPADAERVIRQFAQDGYDVVVTTSFGYMNPTINVAQAFPDTTFVHISGFMTAPNVSTAFGKIEEPRYVSGLIAGAMTESNQIGYVAAFPIPEVIRGINAFTLGVRQANPEATVNVVWTNTWFEPQLERQGAEALLDAGADIIAQHQDTTGPQLAAQDRGAYGVGYNADMARQAPEAVLTSPIWNWGVYYTMMAEAVRAGTWESNQYWGGWEDGVVGLAPLADFVPDDVRATAEAAVAEFESGEATIFTIFTGPLTDQAGEARVADGVAMTAEELLSMNWFVAGVVGELPDA